MEKVNARDTKEEGIVLGQVIGGDDRVGRLGRCVQLGKPLAFNFLPLSRNNSLVSTHLAENLFVEGFRDPNFGQLISFYPRIDIVSQIFNALEDVNGATGLLNTLLLLFGDYNNMLCSARIVKKRWNTYACQYGRTWCR
jgi:hypothetical protein